MKKINLVALMLGAVLFVSAQQQPPGIEQRLQKAKEIMQKEVQMDAAQQKEVEAAFRSFLVEMDNLHKQNPPPPPPPPDPKMKEAMDKLVSERDEKVKKILTGDQYKKYLEAEKKLRPPHPGNDERHGPPPPPPKV